MKDTKTLLIVAALVVVALGGGFFVGMQFQKMRRPSFAQYGQQIRGRFGQGAAMRPVRGQVLSTDATGMTVKLPDGSSRIVVVSSTTTFMKSAPASQSDVKTGDTVMVVGSQNSDGSVTAQTVAVNPAGGVIPTPAK